jgi:hypothetical protein
MANKLTYGPGMAFDLTLPEHDENARQAELDESDAEVEESIKSVTDWCKAHLSEKDITKLVNALLDNNGSAQDEPAPFPGRPRTGGAMDGSSPFYGRMDTAPPRRVREMNTAERLSLDAVCPGLSRIKII